MILIIEYLLNKCAVSNLAVNCFQMSAQISLPCKRSVAFLARVQALSFFRIVA